jgi:hypothetical protein
MDTTGLPNSGETPEIKVWIGKTGYITRKIDVVKYPDVIMSKQEKKRNILLSLRWAADYAANIDSEVTVMPSFKRLPSRDEILLSKITESSGEKGAARLESLVLRIAEFVSAIKGDYELIITWLEAASAVAIESSTTDLMLEFNLGGSDYQVFKETKVGVDEAIREYNKKTSIEGEKVAPATILRERQIRDKGILKACEQSQHLIVLHMDYGMLPAKYTRRHDFSNISHDRKLVTEKKDALLKAYRQDAIDLYLLSIKQAEGSSFGYESWKSEFLKAL